MQIAKTEGSESETPRNLITKPYYLRGSSATNGRYKQNIGNGMTKNNNNPIIISKQEQIKPPNNNSGKNYMTISNANRTYSHFLPKIKLEEVNANTSDDEMKELAKSIENVKNYIDGKEIVKEVIVPKKLVSIVVK